MDHVILKVGGMSRGLCAMSIERALLNSAPREKSISPRRR